MTEIDPRADGGLVDVQGVESAGHGAPDE